MTENTFVCSRCGEISSTDTRCLVDEEEVCELCAEEETVLCAHCGTRIWRDDNAGDEIRRSARAAMTATTHPVTGAPHLACG